MESEPLPRGIQKPISGPTILPMVGLSVSAASPVFMRCERYVSIVSSKWWAVGGSWGRPPGIPHDSPAAPLLDLATLFPEAVIPPLDVGPRQCQRRPPLDRMSRAGLGQSQHSHLGADASRHLEPETTSRGRYHRDRCHGGIDAQQPASADRSLSRSVPPFGGVCQSV